LHDIKQFADARIEGNIDLHLAGNSGHDQYNARPSPEKISP